jgi:hypothetical protein
MDGSGHREHRMVARKSLEPRRGHSDQVPVQLSGIHTAFGRRRRLRRPGRAPAIPKVVHPTMTERRGEP